MNPAPASPPGFVLMIADTREDFDFQRAKVRGSEFRMRRVTLSEFQSEAGRALPGAWSSGRLGAAVLVGPMDDLHARATLLAVRRLTALPVVVLLGAVDVQVTVELLNLGGNEVLPADTPAAELLATLRSRRRRLHTGTLEYGPLSLDPALYLATLGGQPMNLSVRETTLLALLMRTPGQLWTHAELTGALWPGEAQVRSNRLEVTLSNLREKFRRKGVEQPFRRVRGKGLTLRAAEDLEADLQSD